MTGWIASPAGRRGALVVLLGSAALLGGCFGTDETEDRGTGPAPPLVGLSAEVTMVRPGEPATVTVDLRQGRSFAGLSYQPGFDLEDPLIDIAQGPCDPARDGCEEWTITRRAEAPTRSATYEIPIFSDPAVRPDPADASGQTLTRSTGAALTVFALPERRTRAGITDMAVSGFYGMALDADGVVWSWGTDALLGSQLADIPAPVPETLPEPAQAVSLQFGRFFAALNSGTLWAWTAQEGALAGNDASAQGAAIPGIAAPVTDLDGGLALDADGTVYELTRASARAVAGLPPITALASGSLEFGNLVVDGAGGVWNVPVNDPATAPGQVTGLPPIRTVDVGDDHALAVARDGSLWAWGRNGNGQLGNGGRNGAVDDTPARVDFPGAPAGARVVAAEAGTHSSVAVLDDGSVWVWGDGGSGQFGNGESGPVPDPATGLPGPRNRLTPAPVPELSGVTNLAAGGGYITALKGNCNPGGTLLAWGDLGFPASEGPGGRPTGSRLLTTPTPVHGFGDGAGCGEYRITVFRLGQGAGRVRSAAGPLDCGQRCAQFGAPGDMVTLTATPGSNSNFDGWDWDCAGTALTATPTLNRNLDCLAYFSEESPGALFSDTLSVTVTPAGAGRVTSSPPGIDCAPRCLSAFPDLTVVELTAASPPSLSDPLAAALFRFQDWAGDPDCADGEVIVDGQLRCEARFARAPGVFRLDVEVRGQGRVSSPLLAPGEQARLNCLGPVSECAGAFSAGVSVTLDLEPAAGWEAVNVFGDCAGTATDQARVTMDADRRCTVVFNPIPTPQEAAALIRADDTSPVAGQSVRFDGRDSHILDPDSGTRFTDLIDLYEWDFEDDGTIDLAGPRGTADVVSHSFPNPGIFDVRLRVTGRSSVDGGTLTATNRLTVSVGSPPAPPGPGPFLLTVRPLGTNRGTIQVSPAGPVSLNPPASPPFSECVDQQCSQSYAAGTSVQLTAVPAVIGGLLDERDAFTRWEGSSCPVAGSGNPTAQVTMDRSRLCAAVFRQVRELTVRVSGGGSVTTSPALISDCTSECRELFDEGTTVTLTPTPDPGQRFSGWTGDPDCADGSVVMVRARTCTAQFEAAGAGFTLSVDVDGGPGSTVTSGDGRIDCPGTCSADYAPGTTVFLSANNGPGQVPGGWTGDCAGFTNPTGGSVVMNGDRSCGAFFQ